MCWEGNALPLVDVMSVGGKVRGCGRVVAMNSCTFELSPAWVLHFGCILRHKPPKNFHFHTYMA